MRTAPQKLRNRTNANQANVVQSSPRTRVNRYIGRLIEARQTESDTADLNFLTLMYKSSEREQRVRAHAHTHTHTHTHTFSTSWRMCSQPLSACSQYHQLPDEHFISAVVLSLVLAALFGLVYLLLIPQYVRQHPSRRSLHLPSCLLRWLSFGLTPHPPLPPSLPSPSFSLPFFLFLFSSPLRGTVVLVLLVFCICFLVACIMYLHVTRLQVTTSFSPSFPQPPSAHTSNQLSSFLIWIFLSALCLFFFFC